MSLFHFGKLKIFEQDPNIHLQFNKIDSIFKEVDLLIAGLFCGNWRETTEISNCNRVLVIGKSKVGKSSLLNFLSRQKKVMKIGDTLVSKTFYPEYVNIKIGEENW